MKYIFTFFLKDDTLIYRLVTLFFFLFVSGPRVALARLLSGKHSMFLGFSSSIKLKVLLKQSNLYFNINQVG